MKHNNFEDFMQDLAEKKEHKLLEKLRLLGISKMDVIREPERYDLKREQDIKEDKVLETYSCNGIILFHVEYSEGMAQIIDGTTYTRTYPKYGS